MSESSLSCAESKTGYTKREALVGAAVMVEATFLFASLGIVARRMGLNATGEVLLALAFPGALVLSMPFTFMKDSSRKVQVLIVGGTLVFLAVIGYVSARF